jgi:hypothetical protein
MYLPTRYKLTWQYKGEEQTFTMNMPASLLLSFLWRNRKEEFELLRLT